MGSEQEKTLQLSREVVEERESLAQVDIIHPLSAPYESDDLTVHMDRTWFPVPPELAPTVIAQVFSLK